MISGLSKRTYALSWRVFILLSVFSLAFLCQTAAGQVDAGAVVGVVRDSTGASVVKSRVTLTSQESGQVNSTTTNSSGEYTFSPVKGGTYTITVEAAGFSKVEHRNVTVAVQQRVLVDVDLKLGQSSELVTVTGDAPQLQTQDASVGQVIDAKKVVDLPLNGRNFTFLAQLSAGVTQSQNDSRGLGATGSFAANGARPAQNNYLLDGIDNNSNLVDFLNGTAYAVLPPPDAIQEFKIQTSNYSAEIGRSAGAVLNATTKSGTNKIHGSAWDFVRNDALDANNYFAVTKGHFSQNQFGGTLGGPIRKDRTFIFGDYQGLRNTQAQTLTSSVPTALQAGSGYTNFSDLITQGKGATYTDGLGRVFPVGTIFDPATTRPVICGVPDGPTAAVVPCGSKAAGTQVGFARTPFAGNVIPANRLDPTGLKLAALYPLANKAGFTGNYVNNVQGTNIADSYDVRADQYFSQKDSAFARFSYLKNPIYVPPPFSGLADGGSFSSGLTNSTTYHAVLNEAHTFSSSLVNEARIGLNRLESSRLQANATTQGIPAQFGIQGITQTPTNGGLPRIVVSNLTPLGGAGYLPSVEYSTVIQFSDDATKTLGRHTMKAGYTFQRLRFSVLQPIASRGNIAFNGGFTDVPTQTGGNTGLAQLVLTPTASTVGGGNNLGGFETAQLSNIASTDMKRNYDGVYFQDDIKVTPKLTVNVGLRYDFFGPLVERNGRQTNFQPGTNGATFLFAQKTCNTPLSAAFSAAAAKDKVAITCTGQPGLQTVQHLNFSPRVGFAYQVTSRVVARAGYGIFFGGFENSSQYTFGDFPFQFALSYASQTPNSPVNFPNGGNSSLATGLTNISVDPALISASGVSVQGEDYHIRTPYNQNFNLSVQYQLSQNQSLQLGYVGNVTRHLGVYIAPNRPSQILVPGQNTLAFSPYPDFASGGNFTSFEASGSYNSLQATYEQRLSHGLSALANFTYSKCMTDGRDFLNAVAIGSFRAATLPGFGISGDYGACDFDIPRVVHVSGTYELPFGRGRMYGAHMGRAADALLGGWSTNLIFTAEDGQPGTIRCSVTTTTTFGCFVNVVPGVNRYTSAPNPAGYTVKNFLNPAAFANAPVATANGQASFAPLGGGPSQYHGPSYVRADFSLFKNFSFAERVTVQLRAEAFNLANTPNFANPTSTSLSNLSTFGQITSLRDGVNGNRQIQFAGKLYF